LLVSTGTYYLVPAPISLKKTWKQILSILCSYACVVGYPSTFEWENACAIYCF